ncbi:ATP-binding cassette domain-containing protein [Siccirubricoccus sp. G192]|uniref:ATP-binding cassette domain-containing protein n=1 Tax=Siccirubricoccus sp. G192 TaxID=2849651 RepID=UPI001C2C80FD|nr:ATP-binding cassette domain-containing protein [Siccirubricoccus sp. G192]MBV1798662.1 ATP-binding cassette domain-containing protein [Siccirubricoccus sp. G192]
MAKLEGGSKVAVRIETLTKRVFGRAGSRTVLDRVSLEIGQGELVALLGLPGSGRAALLRVVAGLDEPDSGRILLEGQDIARLPPRRRGIAHVFQHDPLFGHPTVFDAVAAAIPDAPDGPAPGAAEQAEQVHRLLGLVGLGEDAGWLPATLPPAQRHRLALARALAASPRLLLLGEAFGTLDPAAAAPRRWLRRVQERLGLTTLLTAHGPAEALAVADRVAVLREGRLEQIGTPADCAGSRRPNSSPRCSNHRPGLNRDGASRCGRIPSSPSRPGSSGHARPCSGTPAWRG